MTIYADSSDLSCLSDAAPRYFSVAEANRSLVLVRRIVEDVVFEYVRLLNLQELIEAAHGDQDSPGVEQARTQMLASVTKLHACLEELDLVGVELRDWSLGIVDFPCLAGGRELHLCWQFGHDELTYWHEVDAGCEGRRHIETLPSFEPIEA